jgi:hypothetical protein
MGLFGRLGKSTYLLSSVLMRYDHFYMCRAGAVITDTYFYFYFYFSFYFYFATASVFWGPSLR